MQTGGGFMIFPAVARLASALFITAAVTTASLAADLLRLAVGAPNNWDTCIPDVGQRAGIFEKHGLQLDILYTQGGGETMQAVISGSADIGLAAGTQSVMGAFAKGAPVRILAAGTTGTGDAYWYVPASSPIRGFADTNGKTAAYSTTGSSSHLTLLALIRQFGTTTRPVATGAGAATFTQTMSGQIDVGWAAPPFGLDALEDGRVRLIARGSDAPSTRDQTVRVHIVNANALARRPDVMRRFMDAYRETYAFLYSSPRGTQIYAEYGKVPENLAIRIREEFMPKPVLSPDKVSGIDQLMQNAVAFRMLAAPLTDAQITELIQIPPPR
jgi:NitT/TauT family transport system substrate-binding protein